MDLKLEKLLVDEDHVPAHTQISMVEKPCTSSRMRSSRRARTPYQRTWLLTCYRSEPAYPLCVQGGSGEGMLRPPSNPLPAVAPGRRSGSGSARRRPPASRRRGRTERRRGRGRSPETHRRRCGPPGPASLLAGHGCPARAGGQCVTPRGVAAAQRLDAPHDGVVPHRGYIASAPRRVIRPTLSVQVRRPVIHQPIAAFEQI